MTEPWVSIDEVTGHLKVTKDTIYRWIAHRGLPATRVGKVWRFRLSEVDGWMNEHRDPACKETKEGES